MSQMSKAEAIWFGWVMEECAEVIEIISRRKLRGRIDGPLTDVEAILHEMFDVMGLLSVGVYEGVLTEENLHKAYHSWMLRRGARGHRHTLSSVAKYIDALPCDERRRTTDPAIDRVVRTHNDGRSLRQRLKMKD